ncbi:LysR family transcriptional regulator [Lichenifustis flavocetrariae]|uniref:HTH-type transcriptional regulator CbbR n=1 Tax=Lichenifustis flavocetrariae TaxID=2949735 RepID=A0AA42CHP7_9HYPH|nr:LysR family transcriptional regulator [Lichenifustis flavocetrariae]MCW6507773.1 LysR family transcriptional regulator [Lichenifustis flavocetrariae]
MAVSLANITLRQLRALAALAESGSVTGAARKLHLTQPAITLQLRAMQDLATLPLIQRVGSGVQLTEAGLELLHLSQRIEAAIADSQQALALISGQSRGRVRIGAVSTAKYFMPFAIAAFTRANPGIEVMLSIGNRETIIGALRGYSLDFAIMGRPPPDVAVQRHLIGDHPHVIIAPAGHWLAHDEGLAVNDLTHEVFLTRELGSGTRSLMERLFATANLTPTIGMEFDSNESIKQGIMAGLGIAFISAHTVATELEDGRLITLDIAGLPLVQQWFAIRRSDKILLPPAQKAFDFMAQEAARFLPKPPMGRPLSKA